MLHQDGGAMSGKKKILSIVCGLLVLATGAAAYLGFVFLNRSLNPALQLNIRQAPAPEALHNDGQAYSPEPIAQKAPAPQAAVEGSAQKTAVGTIMPTPDAAQAPLKKLAQQTVPAMQGQAVANDITHCGYSGTMIILFLGTDERQELPYGADAIRFFKVDYSNLSVACVDLSRDLWVKTPALANRKIKAERLGNIFDIVQMSTKGTFQEQYLAATTVLTQTIFDNFGVKPDHYITVPLSNFPKLVDGLGGIEVEVPQDIDAYKHVILAGKRNLNGQQALAYIRQVQTFGLGDLDRNARQLPYIKALLARMVEPANMVKLPGIINQLQERMVTDLSPALLASLTCMLSQVPRANITFHSLKLDMTSPGPEATLLPDTAKINPWLQDLLKK
jgi:LCP family protein required for cell wall assembly